LCVTVPTPPRSASFWIAVATVSLLAINRVAGTRMGGMLG
jgi:hypothetical protein